MSIVFRSEFDSTMRNSSHHWGQAVLCRYKHTNYYDALTRFSSQKPNILHWFYSSLFGCMKHNCSGSHYAEHTSYNPQKMQSLLENHMCQSCTAYKKQNPQPIMFTLDSSSHHLPQTANRNSDNTWSELMRSKPDYNAQCTQGSDQYRWSKGVSSKIRHLPHKHCQSIHPSTPRKSISELLTTTRNSLTLQPFFSFPSTFHYAGTKQP